MPQGSSHKEAILNDNLQLVAESGKNSPIQAVAAYPSMLFVLCGRCPLMIELAMNEMECTARIKGTHPHFTQEILESAKLRFFVSMQGASLHRILQRNARLS